MKRLELHCKNDLECIAWYVGKDHESSYTENKHML